MKTCCWVLGFCIALTSSSPGCGSRPASGLNSPEQLTLYSIDGRDFEPGEEKPAGETFRGYPVLGKIEVTEADKRNEIIAALNDGIARSDGKVALCFWPRHAIRAVENGRTVDYVICIECLQVKVFTGRSVETKLTTRDPQKIFNKHLKDAGVPLAPGMIGDDK